MIVQYDCTTCLLGTCEQYITELYSVVMVRELGVRGADGDEDNHEGHNAAVDSEPRKTCDAEVVRRAVVCAIVLRQPHQSEHQSGHPEHEAQPTAGQ